jgi:alkylation response protein AidB-like acyl-CoA dehydrogenase
VGHRAVKIFNEQHDMFRATVRAFVDKEIAPHVEEWEQAGRMPRAGADVLTSAVLHEECARSRSGSFAVAVGVHCDMASPHLYWTGSEALFITGQTLSVSGGLTMV